MVRSIPYPELVDGWFQYGQEHQSVRVATVLKAVRIASALNAAARLGEHGYTHEMAVLLRTVDDFIDEISFLLAGEEPNVDRTQQQRFLDDFFSMRLLPAEELLALKGDMPRLGKKKIRAGHARHLNKDDPHSARQMALAVDHVLDSYVHGAYPAIMELYNGTKRQFHMHGMDGTVRIGQYQKQHSFYVYRALALFSVLAFHLRLTSLGNQLGDYLTEYRESGEYDRPGADRE